MRIRGKQGRALHVIDIENLLRLGGDRVDVGWLRRAYDATAARGCNDLARAAASTFVFKEIAHACRSWTPLFPAGGGPDAADRRLLGDVDPAWTADRFDRVVIGSGDHAFAPLARKLGSQGVEVWAVSWHRSLSRELRQAADVVHYLDGYGERAAA